MAIRGRGDDVARIIAGKKPTSAQERTRDSTQQRLEQGQSEDRDNTSGDDVSLPSPPQEKTERERTAEHQEGDNITGTDPSTHHPDKAIQPHLPRLSVSPTKNALMTPQRKRLVGGGEDDATANLTSSAIKGGAADGLLSLARGN